MKHIIQIIKTYPYELLLGLICFALFATNYVPGAYIAGWDNLQTDLNPLLGVKRALFSAWQEYQSFGLPSGMAHAADLPRSVIIALLSLILPAHLTRYTFLMGMVPLAGFGMFTLLRFCGFDRERKLIAFLGSVFYILNLSVIQLMALPYDPFALFFGLLPWEIWIFLKVLTDKTLKRKDVLVFIFINSIGVSQFVPQQLFAVYGLILSALGIGVFLNNRTFATMKRLATLALLLLSINSYWILPQLYFLSTNSAVIQNAKQNQLTTEDIFYLNKDKGNLADFLSFTGFFYDRFNQHQEPIFAVWQKHYTSSSTRLLIYGLSAIYLVGFLHRSPFRKSFLIAFSVIAVVLLSNTFPFDLMNSLIRKSSLINQIFRSPFTKFGIAYACVASYFFACGLLFIFEQTKLFTQKARVIRLAMGFIITSLLIGLAIPAFQGRYIAKDMKVKIPSEYFSLVSYMNQQNPNTRIALLPDYTFWGWFYHRWGYNGSGFLWYALEQPIISRTFDVWSMPSESYFWEVKNALESENEMLFQNVLEKYAVDYLVFDKSLLPIVSNTKAIQYDRIQKVLDQSSSITLEKQWNFLSVYRVRHAKKIESFVWKTDTLPNIGPHVTVTNADTAYYDYGDYQTDEKKPYEVFYPFLDLTTQTRSVKNSWRMEENQNSWYVTKKLPFDKNSYIASPFSDSFSTRLYLNSSLVDFVTPLQSLAEKKKVIITFPKVLVSHYEPANTVIENRGNGKGTVKFDTDNEALTITSENGAIASFGYGDDHLDQSYGYIVTVETENTTGQRLFFYVSDKTKDQAYIEDRLVNDRENYIIGSRYQYGTGYTFGFQNTSYNTIPSTNTVKNISLYAIPYEELKQSKLLKSEVILSTPMQDFSAKKLQNYLYSVRLQTSSQAQHPYIILAQAYDPGWRAYRIKNNESRIMNSLSAALPFLFGDKLKEHIMVNNWENGWTLDNLTMKQFNNETIVILYLPQYLEYLGFVLLGITAVVLLVKKSWQ